ncbi:glycosyltransferase [Providencia rettgeri]|uniref:glycosyltransferase n=1 Tax=Providencia rettgeri TaxID=587 RepID=UPI002B3F114F|nr:glycosyltransferase [Providencia rettgeri]
MNNYTLSIVIPVYNVEKYIYTAVKSVIDQTVQADQIIIVDDGSTDESIHIIKPLINELTNVILISKENGGLSSARNKGLSLVNSDFVYFFDSDDILDENFVRDFKLLSSRNDFDIYLFSGKSFSDDKDISFKDIPTYSRDKLQKTLALNYFYYALKNKQYYSSVCLCVFKTNVINENNILFPNILHEDEAFLPLVIFHSKNVISSNKVYFHRRVRANSIMTSRKGINNINGYLHTLNVYSKIIKNIKCKKLNKLLKEKHDQFLIYILKICIFTDISYKELPKLKAYHLKNSIKSLILKHFKVLYSYYANKH